MSRSSLSRWSIIVGIPASIVGIILNFQLERIVESRVSLVVFNTVTTLSLCLTLGGLLAALVGGSIWAYSASGEHLAWAGS